MTSVREMHRMVQQFLADSMWYSILSAHYTLLLLVHVARLFDLQHRLGTITSALRAAAVNLLHHMVIIATVVLAFAVAAVLLLGRRIGQFSELRFAIQSCIMVAFGQFQWEELAREDPVNVGLWLSMYLFFFWFILGHMAMAIILTAYLKVRRAHRSKMCLHTQLLTSLLSLNSKRPTIHSMTIFESLQSWRAEEKLHVTRAEFHEAHDECVQYMDELWKAAVARQNQAFDNECDVVSTTKLMGMTVSVLTEMLRVTLLPDTTRQASSMRLPFKSPSSMFTLPPSEIMNPASPTSMLSMPNVTKDTDPAQESRTRLASMDPRAVASLSTEFLGDLLKETVRSEVGFLCSEMYRELGELKSHIRKQNEAGVPPGWRPEAGGSALYRPPRTANAAGMT